MQILSLITRIDTLTGFDRWGPDANPLIAQTKRQKTRYSLRMCIWLALGIGVMGLVVAFWQVWHAYDHEMPAASAAIMMSGWALTLVMPMIMAIVAAVSTRQITRSPQFSMIHLTPMTNLSLTRALIYIAFYRARALLVVLVGIMPLLMVQAFHQTVIFHAVINNLVCYYCTDIPAPSYWEVIGPTLVTYVLLLGLWGMTLLATVIGVRAALLHQTILRVIASMIAMLGVNIGGMLIFGVAALVLLNSVDHDTYVSAGIIVFLAALFIMPYSLARNSMHWTAYQWQR